VKSVCVYRLLLWDCDERSYSYYVELSTNQQHWVRVIDHTKVACRSVNAVFLFIVISLFSCIMSRTTSEFT